MNCSRRNASCFKEFQHLFRTSHDAKWHARQFRDIYTVTASDASRCNAMQEDYAALLIIADSHGIDAQVGQFVSHSCQFVVVRREERARSCYRVEGSTTARAIARPS